MIRKRSFKEINFHSGVSELISFLCIFPIMITVFIMTVNLFQVGFVKEKTLYTAYSACRAASVSTSLSDARVVARDLANENIGGSYTVDVDVNTMSGAIWAKGNYVKTTIHVHTSDNFLPFFDPNMSQSIVMIIENSL